MEDVISALRYEEKLLGDKYRPRYHFAIPGDNGMPGDPNGAFFADGIYHLMFLYRNTEHKGFHWGHLTSLDLLHWRRHKDALSTFDGDEGCFSGGAFLDSDGTAYLTFWKFPAKDPSRDNSGIAMAYSRPPYEDWIRLEPIAINGSEWGILDLEINGEVLHVSNADPSNIFKCGKYYYLQTGNLCVLDKYGRAGNSPEKYRGGWTDLFRSEDLKNWQYLHRFYPNTWNGENGWPDATEDDMCPSFLPLFDAEEGGSPTGKWLQLFISHNHGCQYFVGSWSGERFYPESHGRMSWKDRAFFAPEALIDDRNRQIMWAWLLDNPENDFERFGWSGVYSFPRVLWLKNGELHMAPASELTQLQYHMQRFSPGSETLPIKNGRSFRIKSTWNVQNSDLAGIRLREDVSRSEYTDVFYDPVRGMLVFDASKSGTDGWRIREEAPFTLQKDEKLFLDIFVDESIIEVYANERQAICRRVYPSDPEAATGVRLLGSGAETIIAWEMAASNLY